MSPAAHSPFFPSDCDAGPPDAPPGDAQRQERDSHQPRRLPAGHRHWQGKGIVSRARVCVCVLCAPQLPFVPRIADSSARCCFSKAIERLSTEPLPPKWPIRLEGPVLNKKADQAATPAQPQQAPPPPQQQQQQQQQQTPPSAAPQQPQQTQQTAPAPTAAAGGGGSEMPWLHDKRSKPEADSTLLFG